MPADYGGSLKTPDADSPGEPAMPQEVGEGQRLELWSWLPRVSTRQARLEERLARWSGEQAVAHWLGWLVDSLKQTPDIGRPEILWRAAGLSRPGLIAQFRWPALNTRLALRSKFRSLMPSSITSWGTTGHSPRAGCN